MADRSDSAIREQEPALYPPVRASGAARLRRSRPRLLAVVLLAALAIAGITWWVGAGAKSPRQAAAEAGAPSPSAILAPVEFRTLRKVVAVRGRVVAPMATTVTVAGAGGSGLPVVTAAPLGRGQLVGEGTVVAEIALRPVIVLSGSIPMFRDLELRSQGRDVLQLQQALIRRGFALVADGVLNHATAAAVARLYELRGYRAPHPGAATPGGKDRGAVVLQSEVAFVRHLPARLVGAPLRLGQKAKEAVAKLSAGELFLTASVSSTDRAHLRIGSRAVSRVGGRRIAGRVSAIGAPTRSRGSTLETHRITIRPRRPPSRDLLGREVQVSITSRGTGHRVHVVPVAAISAAADGAARLLRVRGGKTAAVRVEAGLSANGFVAVRARPRDLRPGDQVVTGR